MDPSTPPIIALLSVDILLTLWVAGEIIRGEKGDVTHAVGALIGGLMVGGVIAVLITWFTPMPERNGLALMLGLLLLFGLSAVGASIRNRRAARRYTYQPI